ncbi:MAG: hypothetical protein LUI06_04235 [Ruminococcus sp.]|nr:hypothetical protein [Ruminococcus sp.]
MTEILVDAVQIFSEADSGNAFGVTGILDKYGNVFGIVLIVLSVIMFYFTVRLRKMNGFYLEMENHDPVIKETGFLPAEAKVGERRSSEIAGKSFSEMQLLFELDGDVYEKWTPDLGSEGSVKIEYNPKNPTEFYIVDKIEGEDAPNKDEDGNEVEELNEPKSKAFAVILVLAILFLGLGIGFLYDFYL